MINDYFNTFVRIGLPGKVESFGSKNKPELMKTKYLALIAALGIPASVLPQQYNILFIAVDDLRPELGCYGNKVVLSPNIDRLAATGITFNHAYCQQAISMASRASLLTGMFPESYGIYKCGPVAEAIPDAVTLNGFFEKAGYNVRGMGKIYHHPVDHRRQFPGWTDQRSQPGRKWDGRGYLTLESKALMDSTGQGPAFEWPVAEDGDYYDGYTADQACKELTELSKKDKPFFLAVGFHKPHLPFNAPLKYWDMYDRDRLKLPDNQFLPENFVTHTKYNFGELRNYNGIPKGNESFSEDLKKTLIHGYYACVSYTDSQIGKVLNQLKALDLEKNTIIVLFGDHGWKLGEHGMWCKHTNFELDTRATLIMRVPGVTPAETDNFVEFLDIYPTLVDLCGFTVPENLDGTSLMPVINKPQKIVRTAAFSIYPHNQNNDDRLVMGYSVGTPDYRYIEWVHVKSGRIEGVELYDHRTDPGENINVAGVAGNETVCKELSQLLREKCRFKI